MRPYALRMHGWRVKLKSAFYYESNEYLQCKSRQRNLLTFETLPDHGLIPTLGTAGSASGSATVLYQFSWAFLDTRMEIERVPLVRSLVFFLLSCLSKAKEMPYHA